MEYIIVIPARMSSSRLPNKPLLRVGNTTLLKLVYDRARLTKAGKVLIAAEHKDICDYCQSFDLKLFCNMLPHLTGTHRCAEAFDYVDKSAVNRWPLDIVVNWQCDEPLVDPKWIDLLVEGLRNSDADIATLVSPLDEDDGNENLVKAVVSDDRCLWFSRTYQSGCVGHIGVYAFRCETLRQLGKLKPSKASVKEGLEQLSWIEAGHTIRAVYLDGIPLSVNTQDDYDQLRKWYGKGDNE